MPRRGARVCMCGDLAPMSSGGGELSPGGTPTASFDIFLSYAWGAKDPATQAFPLQQKAHAIHRALCAAGYTVWLDTERMPHSATTADAGLDAAMCSGISGSAVVVICFSASYATSVNCKAEASYAKRRRKPTLYVNIGEAPSAENPRGYDADAYDDDDAAVVASVAWLSMHISDSLWADCRSPERMPSGIAQLLTSLSGIAKLRKPSSSSGGSAWGSSGGGAWGSSGGGGASSGGALPAPTPTPTTPTPAPSAGLLRLGTIPWSDVTLLPSSEAPALLGQGAFGRVYRGRWGGLSVAVKEILPDALPPSALAAYDSNEALLDCSAAPSPLQTLIRRFIREAEVMRESCCAGAEPCFFPPPVSLTPSHAHIHAHASTDQLNHPKVVRVYRLVLDVAGARAGAAAAAAAAAASPTPALLRTPSPVAMVCDLMRCDASQFLALLEGAGGEDCSGALALALRLQIATDVCEGLAYLHAQGMVHGDLKLANILVDDRGCAKLADFGLSRVLSGGGKGSTLGGTSAGGASSISAGRAGTVVFMAPELFVYDAAREGFAAPSRSSDVYALGVTLWELFALPGATPYPNFNDVQVMKAVEAGKRPSLEELEEGLPQPLLDLMRSCWAQERAQRPKATAALGTLQALSREWSVPETWAPPWAAGGLGSGSSGGGGGGRARLPMPPLPPLLLPLPLSLLPASRPRPLYPPSPRPLSLMLLALPGPQQRSRGSWRRAPPPPPPPAPPSPPSPPPHLPSSLPQSPFTLPTLPPPPCLRRPCPSSQRGPWMSLMPCALPWQPMLGAL